MWFLKAPATVLGLVAVTLIPSVVAKPYPIHLEEARQLQNASQLERRIVCGQGQFACGQDGGHTCCNPGEKCGLNPANNQAVCTPGGGGGQGQGQWSFTTIVTTGVITQTTVLSSFIGGGPTPQATANCPAAQFCSSVCCESGYWCKAAGECWPVGGSTPGASGIINPSAPLRPTSSTLIVITATGSPTATLPFATPIATGVNGTAVETTAGGGLSGGAIAGIVIGVIAGIILLLLICFYCCAKAAFDSILALFGLGGKKRRRHEETTYIEEHHRHGGSAAAGGRRWHGQGSSRPSRPPMKEKSSGLGGMLGLGAGLAGLAAVLGMKRKHDHKHDDKSTTVSGSSYYYSDYTSSSSASSDDRRTRNTRHSSRR
ncbi:hypothetical protein CC80DRAFT_79141 [Byssothecium circinans]|uniref:Mid2 domain-containing protein n=1 Tax=Byssothecium circinans TaxID=147558 RepID=A0A6A5TU05_9PLEO|nr:hypothetical protein CC80DRAFT_79141 [Byssothecium circinans]